MSEPPSRLQLERLRQEYDRLREGSGGALDRIDELEAANLELEESLSNTASRYETLEQQHSALRAEAANVVELRRRYDVALQHLEDAETKVRALTADNDELRESERLRWFLYGGGVVFAAWLVGFITGRMQRRRRPGLQY
jgi:SH3 domain protein